MAVFDARERAIAFLDTSIGAALSRKWLQAIATETRARRDVASTGKDPDRSKMVTVAKAKQNGTSEAFRLVLATWLLDTYGPEHVSYRLNALVADEVKDIMSG